MKWLQLDHPESIASPGLLVDPDLIQLNIQRMISMVGGPDYVSRLRPHVKTYKLAEVVRMQLDAGINKFKAATIAELNMVATAGSEDVLLAYQPVGPNLVRLAESIVQFPNTNFAALVDNIDSAQVIADRLGDSGNPFRLFIDIDCGMHRTGIPLGPELEHLRDWIESQSTVTLAGLHVYDGHIHDAPLDARRDKAIPIIESVQQYNDSRPLKSVIGGGSPSFGFWAGESTYQCSPGTTLLWDVGYGLSHPDLEFDIASALLTRVISKPTRDMICLDLGYKAVASEMPLENRVTIPAIPDAQFVGHSEEHLVIRTAQAKDLSIGDPLVAYPRHICPTVALHAYANVVRNGQPSSEMWRVAARDRI